MKTQEGLLKVKKQVTTDARERPCRSVRPVYRYALFHEEFGGHLPPECKHNVDSTAILVSMEGDDYVFIVLDPSIDRQAQAKSSANEGVYMNNQVCYNQ